MTIKQAIRLAVADNYLYYRRLMMPALEAFSMAKQWSSESMVRASYKERRLTLID